MKSARCAMPMMILALVAGRLAAVDHSDLIAAQQLLADQQPRAALERLGPALSNADLIELDGRSEAARRRAAEACTLRGMALLADGQITNAIASYRQAVQLAPDLTAAHDGLLQALIAADDWDAVQAALAPRLLGGPHGTGTAADHHADAGLILTAITAAARRHDHDLQRQLAELGMQRFPLDARFRAALARAALASDDWLQAERAAAWLVANEPGAADWWRLLAAARQRQGDSAGASQALQVASALNPSAQAAASDLLALHLHRGQHRAALQLAQAVMASAERTRGPRANHNSLQLRDLALRAAWQAGDLAQAAAWLADWPAGTAHATQRHQWQLRLASAADDHPTALQAAEALLLLTPAALQLRLQAAHHAERDGQPIVAESHLRALLSDQGTRPDTQPWTNHARLQLARLLIAQQRLTEATDLVAAAVANDADPTLTRALTHAIARAQPSPTQ